MNKIIKVIAIKWKTLIAVMTAVILAGYVIIGLTGGQAGSYRKPEYSTVNQTSSTVSGSGEVVYFMAGRIVSEEEADISSRITARIVRVNVEAGAHVNQGDPLIMLDSRDLDAQVEQARAAVSVAEATLVKVETGTRPEQLVQARAACDAARSICENARLNLARNQQLFAAGAISQSQLDIIQTQFDSAQAGYESSQAALDMMLNGETRETVNVAESQVDQARASLDYALALQGNAEILAPISGTVTAMNVNNGEMALAGASLLTIINEGSLAIDASVPAAWSGRISEGQAVRVRVSEMPDRTFSGVVTVIGTAVDTSWGVIPVTIRLTDHEAALKAGMFAEIGLDQ